MNALRRLATSTVAAVAIVGLLAGCGSATDSDDATSTENTGTVDITSATTGESVAIPVNPERVVVLDSTAIEALDALGVDKDKIVGIPKGFLRDDLANPDVEDVNAGNIGELDFEAIDALNPDLVLAGWRFSPPNTEGLQEGFDQLGVPVIELSPTDAHTAESLKQQVTDLGEIFEKQDEAVELNKKFDDVAAKAKAATENAGTGLVVMTSGGKVYLTTNGPDSRSGIYYDTFGIKPAMDLNRHIASHGDEMSFEAIRQANPDWLYVIDRDASLGEVGEDGPAAQVLDNALVNDTPAGSQKQIVYFDPAMAYLGEGIETFLDSGQKIIDATEKAQS